MPTYRDAAGYLSDLAKEVDEDWFTMICDLAAVSGTSALDQPTSDILFALYTNGARYIGIAPSTVAVAAAAPATPADFLEQLSGFTNFKLLGDTLNVTFKKRITLIFGVNGSGKSSLFESLKTLAAPEQPSRPLHNVRAIGAAGPAFHYKFKSDSTQQAWTHTVGYGPRRESVKYFDTAIAIKNVRNAVEPGRIIELTPFKLHLFEWTKALTTTFRERLQRSQSENSVRLNDALEVIRKEFVIFKGRPLATIADDPLSILSEAIKLGEGFAGQKSLLEKQSTLNELRKAASGDGLKLLRAEHRELEALLGSVATLLTSAAALWALEPVSKATLLAAKQAEQEVLAKALIPKDGTLGDLISLLRVAQPMCRLDAPEGHACPLCRRDLGIPEVELFRRYYELLSDQLEMEISTLKGDIEKAQQLVVAIERIDRGVWDKYSTVQADTLGEAKSRSDLITLSCDVLKQPTLEASETLKSLKMSAIGWADQLEAKRKAIEAGAMGAEELSKQAAVLQAEIEPIEYVRLVADSLEKLKAARTMAAQAQVWLTKLPAFTQLLRRITDTAKHAHEELVVADFEARLNAEYQILTEKDMAAFGVTLARKGTEALVMVLPQVGGSLIEGVLSEGEQRVHALALFFAELETCPQSVLIFDDPVCSFDYNYITNYCLRLRDFTLRHPTRQIIALTHNWEFFVQLQTTLKQAGLDGHLSVQVLENCVEVADYSEKIDDLKNDVSTALAAAGEPSKAKKEEMAGKMRRLIESVVNTHVFNQQRHQYKQKSQAVSLYQRFTKLVPLLPVEATTLGDLYAKLSVSEHDDPRNAYVNTDKAMFQNRYNQILVVESAIIARIPP